MSTPLPPREIAKLYPHLRTKAAYAQLLGVSRQSIDQRLASGTLTAETVPEGGARAYINVQTYPPERPTPGRWPNRPPGSVPLPRRNKPATER